MEKRNDRLFVGPWIGEFGWEICQWIPHVRFRAQKYDSVLVMTKPSSAPLYFDITNYFSWTTKPPHGSFSDTLHIVTSGKKTSAQEWLQMTVRMDLSEYDVLCPSQTAYNTQDGFLEPIKSERINLKYGAFPKSDYPIIFHIRNRTVRQEDNWPETCWKALFLYFEQKGFPVACIGSTTESLCIDGAKDLRNCDLDIACDYIAGSRLVVGPSSGAMHLAAFCGAPHLVWSIPYNRNRYTRQNHWNPFGAKCIFYDKEGWRPSPSSIVRLIEEKELCWKKTK